MRVGEQPYQQPAVGVANDYVRWRVLGLLEKACVGRGSRPPRRALRYWEAVAESRTVIRGRRCVVRPSGVNTSLQSPLLPPNPASKTTVGLPSASQCR
jgi:hypothetical protein